MSLLDRFIETTLLIRSSFKLQRLPESNCIWWKFRVYGSVLLGLFSGVLGFVVVLFSFIQVLND